MQESSRSKAHADSKKKEPASKYSIQQEGTRRILLIFHHTELALYWHDSNQSREVLTQFAGVKINQNSEESISFQTTDDTSALRSYLDRQLINISWHTLTCMRLNEPEMHDFFQRSKLAKDILRPNYFIRWKIVDRSMGNLRQGDLVLWNGSISESLAQEKCYELEGFGRVKVILDSTEVTNFEGLRSSERCVLMKVLAYKRAEVIRRRLATQQGEVQLVRIQPINQQLHLELICFKRCLLAMYEGLMEELEHLKYKIEPFCRKTYPERNHKLSELLEQFGEMGSSNPSAIVGYYYEFDDFLVVLDVNKIDDRIAYLLTSEPHLIRLNKKEMEFVEEHKTDFLRTLKNKADLIDYKFMENGLEVISNHRNFIAAAETIQTFVAQRMKIEAGYKFKSEMIREIFFGYFHDKQVQNHPELSIRKDDEDRSRIIYMCSLQTKTAFESQFKSIGTRIQQGYTRIFVPVHFANAIKSPCARLNSQVLRAYNPLCYQGYELQNHNPAIVRVIDHGPLETVRFETVICLYYGSLEFTNDLCEYLLERHGSLQTFRQIKPKEHLKSFSHSYVNDTSCNVSEIMCCLLDSRGYSFVDQLRSAISAALDKDGIGIIVPQDFDAAELVFQILANEVLNFSNDKTFKETPTLKNFYLICSSEPLLKDTEDTLEKIAKQDIKLIPLNLSISDLYALNLANFYNLQIPDCNYLPTPLVGFVVRADLLCRPTSHYEGLVVNLPLDDGQLYSELFIDFDAKNVYDLTRGTIVPFRDYVKNIDDTIIRYTRALYEIVRQRRPPRIAVVYINEQGKLIDNHWRVRNKKLVRAQLDGTRFVNREEESLEFTLEKTISIDCNVLEGYCQDVLSIVMRLQ